MAKTNIIIPVHNRRELTKQTIESLYNNTKAEFDLWVADDGSERDTMDLLIELQHKYGFKLFRNKKPQSPGVCRNVMTKLITTVKKRGKYLYHSDNDVFFTKKWLKVLTGMYDLVTSKGLKLLGASCHPYLQNNETWNFSQPFEVGIKDAVSGYSQLMEWSTWDKYGPFDETMRSAKKKIMGSEDWAFCQKIIEDGFQVGSIEPEVVIPCGRTNTYGEKATGHETFKEHYGVIIK